MSMSNAMEKTRLALDHLAKVVFGQTTELLSADLNKGLAPGLAATNPSVNFAAKGLDVALASYVAELGFLANPVSTHAQFAENFNEAIK
jgi:phenylalanine ammonia-lyase